MKLWAHRTRINLTNLNDHIKNLRSLLVIILKCILFFAVALPSHAQITDFNHIDFSRADQIARLSQNNSLHNMPELVYDLTHNLDTDVEKFRAIYMWVCLNISNDYALYYRNKRKKNKYKNNALKLNDWNNQLRKEVFRKLLKRNTTICTGYAFIIQELSNLADLNCKIIHGYGQTSRTSISSSDPPNHSWNAIKLNGKWYLCDPTWASGIPNPQTNLFKFEYNDGYFLTNPELFRINHFPQDQKWTLLDTDSQTFESFLNAPILYGKAYIHLSKHEMPKTMHQELCRNEKVNFKYQLKKSINETLVQFVVDNGYVSKTVRPKTVSIDNQSLFIEHQFTSKGFYDVHLYFDKDLISTYTFKVK